MIALIKFVTLSFALLAAASPLGDRAILRRYTGVPQVGARRFILESRVDSPPACAALPTSNVTIPSDTSNSTAVDDSAPSLENTTLSKRHDDFDFLDTWQDLCFESGGDILTNDPCFGLGWLDGFTALLPDADPCDQQDIADAMITFAKSEGVVNADDLITTAIGYRKHPRKSVNILGVVPSTPYCLNAPINSELDGIYNGQSDDCDPGLFGGPDYPLMSFGDSGTCPYGMSPDVSTCSCLDSGNTTDVSGDIDGNLTDSSAGNVTDTSAGSVTDTGAGNVTDSIAGNITDTSAGNVTDTSANATVTATDLPVVASTPAATAGSSGGQLSGNINDPNGR